MNILYGIQGTGNGHINRSREVVTLLKKHHNVSVILSGREEKNFFAIDDLSPYHIYNGLTFSTKDGTIDYIETAKNLKISKFYKDISEYSSKHDLVITDFEPITSRIAKKLKIPSIGLAHQYAFNYPLPGKKDFLSESVIKLFAPADIEIGIHWWHFGGLIIPPILPAKLQVKENNNSILVYLPWMKKEKVIKVLNSFLDYKFDMFHPVEKIEKYDNVTIHPLSRGVFLEYLSACEGVLCNAGFQLSSEAISLNKKLFVIPINGQPEQENNAEILKELNLGMTCSKLCKKGLIEYWLNSPNMNNGLYFDIADKIVNWINKEKLDKESLMHDVWNF